VQNVKSTREKKGLPRAAAASAARELGVEFE